MKIRNFLPGTAAAEVSGAAPEGFLNICSSFGPELISVSRAGDFSLLVEFPAAELERAERAALQSRCSLKLLRDGYGARAGRLLRRRAAAAVLALIFVAVLFWSKFFVWEIEISGNDSVSSGRILACLAEAGVESGKFWPGFSSEDIRSRVLAHLPELSWISVNMQGSLAQVQVVERVLPPELVYKGSPTDIVAAKDGFVTAISAPVGTALVSRGAAVSAGDILISGAVESSFAQPRFLRAQGSVTAETFTLLQAVSPEKITAKSYTGRESSRFALIIGDMRINFYSDSSISGEKCDTIVSVWKAEIKGLFSLPLSIVRETDRFYESRCLPADGGGSLLLMDAVLDGLLAQSIGEGEVLDCDRDSFVSDGLIRRVLRARCLEEIGLAQPMSSQRIDEANYFYQQKADETNGGTQN